MLRFLLRPNTDGPHEILLARAIFAHFMNERDFQNLVSEWISRKVYTRFRAKPEA
jgi:hypothetical protein